MTASRRSDDLERVEHLRRRLPTQLDATPPTPTMKMMLLTRYRRKIIFPALPGALISSSRPGYLPLSVIDDDFRAAHLADVPHGALAAVVEDLVAANRQTLGRQADRTSSRPCTSDPCSANTGA